MELVTKSRFIQTEIGSIPNDWALMPLKDLGNWKGGGTPSKQNRTYWNGNIPWISPKDFKDVLISTSEDSITEIALLNSTANLIAPNSIVVVLRSGILRHRVPIGKNLVPVAINQDIKALTVREDYDTNYILYSLINLESLIRKRIVKVGTTVESIDFRSLKDFVIAVPPTHNEQTAIATALRDADALIASLEKLIAKKQLVKQGVLQELLMPKKDWIKVNVADLGNPYGGLSGKSRNDFGDGEAFYIPFMNIMSNPIIDSKNVERVRVKSGEYQNRAKRGDLFFNGSSETPEEVGMCSVLMDEVENLYLNSFCFGFRLNSERELNGLFLSYLFRSSFGRHIFFSLAQGATRYNLSKSNFLKLQIDLPSFSEQNRITSILNDIDNEIAVLEKKLDKQRLLKQGMMQNLLTGKIRLI